MASNLSRFSRWIKGFAQAIRPLQRIEMTVQTDRVLIIRQRQWRRVWCQQCGCEVDAVSVSEAKGLVGTAQALLPGDAESQAWHVCTGKDGEQFICLQSLLKAG